MTTMTKTKVFFLSAIPGGGFLYKAFQAIDTGSTYYELKADVDKMGLVEAAASMQALNFMKLKVLMMQNDVAIYLVWFVMTYIMAMEFRARDKQGQVSSIKGYRG